MTRKNGRFTNKVAILRVCLRSKWHFGSRYSAAVLNNVKPNLFSIGNPLEDVAKVENIYVYIFDSEQARKDGLKTFNQHLEFVKLTTYPTAYEQKNALVIYFSFREKDTKFGEKIQIAMQKM